ETVVNSWKEKTAAAAITLPFNFSRGVWSRYLSISANGKYTDIDDMKYPLQSRDEPDDLYGIDDGTAVPVGGSVVFSNQLQWAADIFPRWGQVFSASYSKILSFSDYQGEIISGRALFYFPGLHIRNVPGVPWLFRSHSLYFEAAAERQVLDSTRSKKEYRFESAVLFPRGYEYEFVPAFAKASVNYAFPVLCPDLNVLYFLYLQRVYINAFADAAVLSSTYTAARDGSERIFRRSAGFLAVSDIRPLNLPLPVSLGVGGAYRFDRVDDEKGWTPVFSFGVQSPI
ncbi:MAG: hypothetical protein ACRCUT_06115, partial [Spirochaetota bacterium]